MPLHDIDIGPLLFDRSFRIRTTQEAAKTPIRCSLYKSHTASLTTPQVSRHETCVRLAERDTLFKKEYHVPLPP